MIPCIFVQFTQVLTSLISSFKVKASALSTQDEDFDRTSAGVDIELRLKRIFDYCCRNGEMDNTNFLKLCRDSDVIDHTFTVIDAELCFLKVHLKR